MVEVLLMYPLIMGLTTLVNILFNFSEPIVLFIFNKYYGFDKGVGSRHKKTPHNGGV
jgi:hypothetical protein